MTNEEIDWTAERRRNRRDTAVAAVCIGIIALILAALLSGCATYRGAKVTEGTNLSVGMNVPATDGALQFQFVSYLTGLQLGVAENAQFKMKYTTVETNDWFGVIHNVTVKTLRAKIEPSEMQEAAE